MNLSIAAILGTGESGRCWWRGVKVWTVRQKSGRFREVQTRATSALLYLFAAR